MPTEFPVFRRPVLCNLFPPEAKFALSSGRGGKFSDRQICLRKKEEEEETTFFYFHSTAVDFGGLRARSWKIVSDILPNFSHLQIPSYLDRFGR